MEPRSEAVVLDLTRLAGNGKTRVLSGKDRGENARGEYGLDKLDHSARVYVRLPSGIDAITPSFVLGMFGKSVEKVGSVDAFLDRFVFVDAPSHIVDQISRGASFSLLKGSPLP